MLAEHLYLMTGYEDDMPQGPGSPRPHPQSPGDAAGNAGPGGTHAQAPQPPYAAPPAQAPHPAQPTHTFHAAQAPGQPPRPPASPVPPWGPGAGHGSGSGSDTGTGPTAFGMPAGLGSAYGPAGMDQPPYPPAYGGHAAPPPPRRRRGLTALIVAGTIAASAVAGGVAGTVAAHRGSSTAATGVPASSTAVNVPASSQTVAPTAIGAVAKAVLPSVVQVTVQSYSGTSLGSGVILSSDGKILTNNHVIADAVNGQGNLTVTFNDGKTAQATIVGFDTGSDLAVIQATGVSGLPAATLGNSDSVQVGDTVVAIGSPDGLQSTVTSGIVSALNRTVTVSSGRGFDASQVSYKAIQTDASINPGNSGGPLLNTSGQVVGINSAIYSPTNGMSQGGSVGLGFSIPVNQVKPLLTKLEAGAQS